MTLDLLLEIGSEEIPARLQSEAQNALVGGLDAALQAAALSKHRIHGYATPRRLGAIAAGLPRTTAASKACIRGPRVGAPPAAIAGFARKIGLDSPDRLKRELTERGEYFVAEICKPGVQAEVVLAEAIARLLEHIPWERSMHWEASGARWIRPVRWILCALFADDGTTIPIDFSFGDVPAGTTSRGHPRTAPGPLTIQGCAELASELENAQVILDTSERRRRIDSAAHDLARARGLYLVENLALLDTLAGLVEWPAVQLGAFDPKYLAVPTPLIRAAIEGHQKCLVTTASPPKAPDAAFSGKLADTFVIVADLKARDNGEALRRGNERVVAARLADAQFFWETDARIPLADRRARLANITFHTGLGSQDARVRRIAALTECMIAEACTLTGWTDAEARHLRRATDLCKCDLVSETVREFPALEGIVGSMLAKNDGEAPGVVHLIGEHLLPIGDAGPCPSTRSAGLLAIADRLDRLAGFIMTGHAPKGSGDPFALRRAGNGIIRILTDPKLGLDLNIRGWIDLAVTQHARQLDCEPEIDRQAAEVEAFLQTRLSASIARIHAPATENAIAISLAVGSRLPHAQLEAVPRTCASHSHPVFNPHAAARHIPVVMAFIDSGAGHAFRTAIKRVHNLTTSSNTLSSPPLAAVRDSLRAGLESRPEEAELLLAAEPIYKGLGADITDGKPPVCLADLQALTAPINAYLDAFIVNDRDLEIRAQRVALMRYIAQLVEHFAAFRQLEGVTAGDSGTRAKQEAEAASDVDPADSTD